MYREVGHKVPPSTTGNRNPLEQTSQRGILTKDLDDSTETLTSNKGTYYFKDDGLVKKTISINVDDIQHHLICYFTKADAASCLGQPPPPTRTRITNLIRPSDDPKLKHIAVSDRLIKDQAFRKPVSLNDRSMLEGNHVPVRRYSELSSFQQAAVEARRHSGSFPASPIIYAPYQYRPPSSKINDPDSLGTLRQSMMPSPRSRPYPLHRPSITISSPPITCSPIQTSSWTSLPHFRSHYNISSPALVTSGIEGHRTPGTHSLSVRPPMISTEKIGRYEPNFAFRAKTAISPLSLHAQTSDPSLCLPPLSSILGETNDRLKATEIEVSTAIISPNSVTIGPRSEGSPDMTPPEDLSRSVQTFVRRDSDGRVPVDMLVHRDDSPMEDPVSRNYLNCSLTASPDCVARPKTKAPSQML
jgi:hypothetical protein